MNTTSKTVQISGDWRDEGAKPFEGVVTFRWSGGVEWRTDRATVEQIVREQDELLADNLDPAEQDRLHWEGDVLVHRTGTAMDGTSDEYRREYRPNADGTYDIGFGWTWYVVRGEEEIHRLGFARALEEFQTAARRLQAAWEDMPGDAVDGYPQHWHSFDEEVIQIVAMRVRS